jgi:hypothetical protein
MKTRSSLLPRTSVVLAALCLGLVGWNAPAAGRTQSDASQSMPTGSGFEFLTDRDVNEPQYLLAATGELLLLWREKGTAGSNLYSASRDPDGRFSAPVRINDDADTVGSYPMDELRAAAASGPAHRIAVAWGDARGQVRVAESTDGGATFAPSRQLEQTATPAYRSFPELAYDNAGTLHAVWIDSRLAADFAEEPADLYYARITPDAVVEHNLTAAQEPSVCGCCRPSIESTGPGVVHIAFRNTTADGYRDIFTITGGLEAGFEAPQAVAEPLWKLQGCPTSGPILAGGEVLWPDGSTGAKLLRHAPFDRPSAALLFSGEHWSPRLPPRPVQSKVADLLLVPGQDASRLLAFDSAAGSWRLAARDLPAWATSAWLADGTLWLIGALDGDFMHLERALEP